MLSSPCEIMPVRWYTNDGNPLSLSCIDTKIVLPQSLNRLSSDGTWAPFSEQTLLECAACTADGNGTTYNEHINVALAVAMPDGGLITPVIKDADSTDIYQISRNWADLVKRARSKQLAPDEFPSGTFTISNLGNFGADIFDAILPPGALPPHSCMHQGFNSASLSLLCTSTSRIPIFHL